MEPPPFLPPRPATSPNDVNHRDAPSQAAAFALRSALTNPYSQAYSSHYAQAYMQQFNPMPLSNAEGYTMSSTYNPNAFVNNTPGPSFSRPPQSSSGGFKLQNFNQGNSTWYQPGNNRCTYKNCSFTGSAKSVETHMMDRHLIYPPGWDKRKTQQVWDADPSLKGKPIPIQGTNLVLNTPDAIEAWVEERKKRWPSSTLIAEKKRKFEEAAARGELSVESLGLFSKKRQRAQDTSQDIDRINHFRGGRGQRRGSSNSNWRGRANGSGRGRGRGRGGGVVHSKIEASPPENQASPPKTKEQSRETDESSSDSDDEPEILSSKLPEQGRDQLEVIPPAARINKTFNQPAPQPKKPPYNPFASRTSLLRNLLLPEIRMTISNLSQAIRFLVDNNFLDGVELKPGEADSRLIQVINSETAGEAPTKS